MTRTLLVGLGLLAALTGSSAHGMEAPPIDFRTDVIAALSRAGCNSGACHGSPQGKNGFRLSLRGFDADLDLFTLTRAEMGRRVDRLRPENSLFLLKGTGRLPHQGGVRLRIGDPAYRRCWAGSPRAAATPGPRRFAGWKCRPNASGCSGDNPVQQLHVYAHLQGRRVSAT